MKENYLSKKQQESLVKQNLKKPSDIPERTGGTYIVLHNGDVVLKNPCKGDTQEARNYRYEREKSLR